MRDGHPPNLKLGQATKSRQLDQPVDLLVRDSSKLSRQCHIQESIVTRKAECIHYYVASNAVQFDDRTIGDERVGAYGMRVRSFAPSIRYSTLIGMDLARFVAVLAKSTADVGK